MNELRLCEVPASDWGLIERIGRLRVTAYESVIGVVDGMTHWLDRFDAEARHWAFLCYGEPVAAARVSVHSTIFEAPDAESYAPVFPQPPPGPIASFNRLVVAAAYRGQGLSKRLDEARLQAAEAAGCASVVIAVYSNDQRLGQLTRAGFVILGEGKPAHDPIAARYPRPPVVLLCRLPRRVGTTATVGAVNDASTRRVRDHGSE
jgi:GNAT superfamily N-acetyltransferase